jgi:hypothetical protein
MIVKETKDLPDYVGTYIRTNIYSSDVLISLHITCDEYIVHVEL